MDEVQDSPTGIIQYYTKKLESKIENLEKENRELKEKNNKLEKRLRMYEYPSYTSIKT